MERKTPTAHRSFAVLLAAATLLSGAAQAQKYQVTVLPTLSGGTTATATAMNNRGVVVGYGDDASGDYSALVWHHGAVTTVFPGGGLESSAYGINDAGFIVGYAYGAFVWGPDFLYQSGYQVSDASNINSQGEIVGSQGGVTAVWTSPAMMGVSASGPAVPPGHDIFDVALDAVNDAGVLVGVVYSSQEDGTFHATRWSSLAADAKIKDLGTLGGASSEPNAINAGGAIAGWAQLKNGRQHAALWGPTTVAYDLGTLGGKESSAAALDRKGNVVGTAQTAAGDWHAVSWTTAHYKAIDLNTEIAPAIANEYTLTAAVATNDHCLIVVNAVRRKTGADQPLLLTPSDPSTCQE